MVKTVEDFALASVNRHFQDAVSDDIRDLEMLVRGLTGAATTQLRGLLDAEGKRHTDGWKKRVRANLGVDLSSVISEGDLEETMDLILARNSSLIGGLGDDLRRRVSQTVSESVTAGRSASDLSKRLREQMDVSRSRADLIATDQTAKVNSELSQFRAQEAGIKKYVWRTSKDERVRSRHRGLDGRVYEYGKPTGAEEGLPPGLPIRCRCTAEPVIEFEEGATEIEKTQRLSAPEPKTFSKSGTKGSNITHDLTQEDMDFIAEYQAGRSRSKVGGYTSLQTRLRDGVSPHRDVSVDDIDKYVLGLESAFQRSVTTKPLTLVRYQRVKNGHPFQGARVGDRITEQGFFSTTRGTSSKLKDKFSRQLNRGDVPTIFKIEVPAGQPAIDVDLVDKLGEKETLLESGLEFEVIKKIGSTVTLRPTGKRVSAKDRLK